MVEFSALQQWIEARMARDGTPGLALVITDRERTRQIGYFGYADLAAKTPVGPEHAFELGSIGKTFTALLLLRLQERGAVDLNQPVRDFLPWFEADDADEPICLRHLITHSAGIIEGSDMAADGRYEAWHLRHQPRLGAPGEHFHYSNVGYKVLGYVIEEITGTSYGEAVTGEILTPLGMDDSFTPITDAERSRVVVGYRPAFRDRPWRPEQGVVPDTWIETGTGDGSTAVTAGDMAIFTRAMLNRGSGLIGDESFALMIGDLAPRDPDEPDATYGCGLATWEDEGRRCFGHGGDMLGYYAMMSIDPEAGIGVAVTINGPGDVEGIASAALAFARVLLAGETAPELPPVLPRTAIENASEYVGVYEGGGESWRIEVDGVALFLAWSGGRARLEHSYAERFIVGAPELEREMLVFEREDGQVIALSHGPRWFGREGIEHSAPAPAPEHWSAYVGWYQCHNPWTPLIRVLERRGKLFMADRPGRYSEIEEIGDGLFRYREQPSADRIRFDAIADGQALRLDWNGQAFYRTLESSLNGSKAAGRHD